MSVLLRGKKIGSGEQINFHVEDINTVFKSDGVIYIGSDTVGENIPIDAESVTVAIEEYEDELINFVGQCRDYPKDPVLDFWEDLK